MKALRLALVTLFGFAFIFSCTKEKSFETGGGGSVNAEWEFKEGKEYKGTVDTAYIEDFGTPIKTLFLEGPSLDGKALLSIEVINISTSNPATYKTPQVLFQYLSSTAPIYTSDVTAIGDFTVVITKIDSANVSGTFTGKAKDSSGASKTIVDGKFSAKLKNSSTPPPPAQNGKLTFWAKQSCTAGGNISVKLSNNQTGTITAFVPAEPNCDATGAANFTVPAGSYTWSAKCGTQDSTSGTITVVANQCVKQEVFFSPPTNCHIFDMAAYDFTSNQPEYTIRTIFNASNKVTNIQYIDSTNGTIANNWVISYPAGRVQIDNNQYFVLDGASRVIEYHGFYYPDDNTSDKIIMKYSYNPAGYLSQFTMEYVDTPGIITYKGVLEYSNGNLTKLTETDPHHPSPIQQETTYDYYPYVVKNFIYTLPQLPEILYFQSAIDVGKKSQNAVKSGTVKLVNSTTGASQVLGSVNYDNYVIDPAPNQYVRSYKQTITGYATEKFVFSYKCF